MARVGRARRRAPRCAPSLSLRGCEPGRDKRQSPLGGHRGRARPRVPRLVGAPRDRDGSGAGPRAHGSDRRAGWAAPTDHAGPRARRLDLHQCDEAVNFGFLGSESGQDTAETQRILAERGSHPVVACRRRVALVEDEVDDLEHRRQTCRARSPVAPRRGRAPLRGSVWPGRSAEQRSPPGRGTHARSRRSQDLRADGA